MLLKVLRLREKVDLHGDSPYVIKAELNLSKLRKLDNYRPYGFLSFCFAERLLLLQASKAGIGQCCLIDRCRMFAAGIGLTWSKLNGKASDEDDGICCRIAVTAPSSSNMT